MWPKDNRTAQKQKKANKSIRPRAYILCIRSCVGTRSISTITREAICGTIVMKGVYAKKRKATGGSSFKLLPTITYIDQFLESVSLRRHTRTTCVSSLFTILPGACLQERHNYGCASKLLSHTIGARRHTGNISLYISVAFIAVT